jgi:hypothetical protein
MKTHKTTLHNTTAAMGGAILETSISSDCLVPIYKTSFGQSVFSVKGEKLWNLLPTNLKLETNSNTFNRELKQWLKSTVLTQIIYNGFIG